MQRETIAGVVEGIVYRSAESGYTVLVLIPEKPYPNQEDETISVVGKFMELQIGESVRFTGTWGYHREYGQQFKADRVELANDTADSAETLLASGAVDGISKLTAKKIIAHFGKDAVNILDGDPSRIAEVPGLTSARTKMITASWKESRSSRKIMLYLQDLGITGEMAHKIYEHYADDTITEMEKNPYQFAMEIDGFDFKLADEIARRHGLRATAAPRLKAGIVYALQQLGQDGHVYAPRPMAAEKASELLEVESDTCDSVVDQMAQQGEIISIRRKDGPSGNVEALYLPSKHEDERRSAAKLMEMINAKETALRIGKTFSWKKFFEKLANSESITLSEQQREAVRAALTHKVNVLTGGPGTGKTTTLRSVIKALDEIKANYILASPTGRAARRLSEATERPAKTLHRALGYSRDGGWLYNEDNPLDCDILIVDETSMVDLELFARLTDALTPKQHLLLVGDVDQLPSVGAGNVLRDVIDSGVAHVTRLDMIFRQAGDSYVVHNAHRINRGEAPEISKDAKDFFLFNVEDSGSEDVLDLLVNVVGSRIPEKFGFDPIADVQVLAPMYKGNVGIHTINERLRNTLNAKAILEHPFGSKTYRLGDKVIQTRNNYELDVYNGDIGRVSGIDPETNRLYVDFDDRTVEYKSKETFDLLHAFAISIHRSQGSEYPAVVVLTLPQHGRMLQRNLLYTAITRAKKLVVLVGTRGAIQIAVENNRVMHRDSGLAWRLNNPLEMP